MSTRIVVSEQPYTGSGSERPLQSRSCYALDKLAESGCDGRSARPFSAELSANLDWITTAIETELSLPQPCDTRLRFLRAIKRELESWT